MKQILVLRPGRAHELARKRALQNLKILGRIGSELLLRRRELLLPTWRLLAHCRRTNPARIPAAITNLVFYFHVSKFVDQIVAEAEARIRVLEAEPAVPQREHRLTAAE